MNYVISYDLEQTTADKVEGVKRDHSKEQVFAIGPGLLYSKNKLHIYCSASFEISVQNRQEGELITFYFMKVF
jgi:Protein involved in meta-pathway of phenol degradation